MRCILQTAVMSSLQRWRNYDKKTLTDNPFIICRSIVEEIVTSIGAEGTYSALPYENCIQVEDIAQTMTDEI